MAYLLAAFLVGLVAVVGGVAAAWWRMIRMPGKRVRGPLPPLDSAGNAVRDALRRDLKTLAVDIGERNLSHRYDQLVAAAEFIQQSLKAAGYETRQERFEVDGKAVWNVEAEKTGSEQPKQVLVVGAHYDTVPGSPGANDNGTAVAANLAPARAFATTDPRRTIRFAFFVNEESPYYMTDAMGSLRSARSCREREETVRGMVSLEMIGCYSQDAGSQRYPVAWLRRFYPTTGNFVAVVGNVASRRLVRRVVRVLRREAFPSEGIAAPRWLKDIFRSDHASFWRFGFPALMITDTANFRYRFYHTPQDTVDKIDFEMLARLVAALEPTFREMVNEG